MARKQLPQFHYQHAGIALRNARKVKHWISRVVLDNGFVLDDLNFIFCSDQYLLELNVQHLNHDTYTDVITFDYTTDKLLSGEIYISYERVKANSKIYRVSLADELHRVMIHGVLHLCGYGDAGSVEKAEMTEKENYCLTLRDF